MFQRNYWLILFLMIFTLSLSSTARALKGMVPTGVLDLSPTPTSNVVLQGHVADPTGALISGAKISVLNSAGTTVATTTANSEGTYEIHGLRPGSYILR